VYDFFLVKIIEIEHMLDVLSSIITICMIITLIEKIIKFNPLYQFKYYSNILTDLQHHLNNPDKEDNQITRDLVVRGLSNMLEVLN
jgi:hypothetical protein